MQKTSKDEKMQILNEIQNDLTEQTPVINRKLIAIKFERNFYLKKLRDIEILGESMNWQDDTGLLQEIKNYFNSLNLNE